MKHPHQHLALRNRVLRSLAGKDDSVVNNVFSCLALSFDALSKGEAGYASAENWLDRAAQHLWGHTPPEDIRVDADWHYYFP